MNLEFELFNRLRICYGLYLNNPSSYINIPEGLSYDFKGSLAEWMRMGRVPSQESLLVFYKDILNFYLEELLVISATGDYNNLYQYQDTLDYIRKYAEERKIDLFGEKRRGYTEEWDAEVMKGYHIINLLRRDGSYTMLWQKMTAEDFLMGEYGRHHWTDDPNRKQSNKLKDLIMGVSPFHTRLQGYTGTRAEALIEARRMIDERMMEMTASEWSEQCLVIAREALEKVARKHFDDDVAEAYVEEVWYDWQIDDFTEKANTVHLKEAIIGRKEELDYQAAHGVEEWLEDFYGDLLNRFANLEKDPRSRRYTILLELFPDFAFYLMLGDLEVDPFEYLGMSTSSTWPSQNWPSP